MAVTDTVGPADCAVVLGAAVRSDGAPGPAFRERLDTAIKLYSSGKVPVIIVSGADPIEGEGHSEAGGAAKYLREYEVAAKSIIRGSRRGEHRCHPRTILSASCRATISRVSGSSRAITT